MIDPAMLRPGRLDKLLYVELPTPGERLDILMKLTKNTPLSADVVLETIANDKKCEGFRYDSLKKEKIQIEYIYLFIYLFIVVLI